MRYISLTCLLTVLATQTSGKCYEPGPAFPVPDWESSGHKLRPILARLEDKLQDIAFQAKYDTSSYSIELTSTSDTLWSTHHTAQVQNQTRPGAKVVDGRSQYRIASITKVFTTLAILHLHDAGKLHLDDPVTWYIPEFNSSDFELPWKDTSLRSLASQLSGLPREFAQSDLINIVEDPVRLGLPPVSSHEELPTCDEYVRYSRACDRKDFIKRLKQLKPLFAPNQKSTYSNLNYEVLGLVIESVTGEAYEEYIASTILKPVSMKHSSFEKPEDAHAVLPVLEGESNYWDVDTGVQTPTGGLYSTSSDLSAFLRYVLTHYNTLATGVNWLMPSSWSTGLQTFYGMPWETFRTDQILRHSHRPVTFVTKSGGLPGYYSKIYILEEYGLGLTILVGGKSALLGELQEIVTTEIVNAAEELTWSEIDQDYSHQYVSVDAKLNSSVTLATSLEQGLHLTSFISNGTDVLHDSLPNWGVANLEQEQGWYGQLVPTLLFKNETTQQGEIWRLEIVAERSTHGPAGIWDAFCSTDIDQLSYAGLPVNEVVFWHEEGHLELPAWNVTLKVSKRQGLVKQSS